MSKSAKQDKSEPVEQSSVDEDATVHPELASIPMDQRGEDPDHPSLQPIDFAVKGIDGVEHDGEANRARYDPEAPKDAKVRAKEADKALNEQFAQPDGRRWS